MVWVRNGKSKKYTGKSAYLAEPEGIRTLDRALQPYNGLANRRLQPLGHSSMRADMPDASGQPQAADSDYAEAI